VDGDGTSQKRILPMAKDWIELEERRRAFWSAFYVDRWASSGTGWPMIIDEADVSSCVYKGRLQLILCFRL
jgi:hypothetical protein